jgi:hypothetical protein
MNIINDINEKWLGNNWCMNMWMDEMPFKCAESAYQSLKYSDPEVKMMFCDLTRNESIEFSRLMFEDGLMIQDFNPLVSMAKAVKAKFESSASLKTKLVNSYPSEIQILNGSHPEISNDHLALILTAVREHFIKEGETEK